MSGTSLDGIDACLVEGEGLDYRLVAFSCTPWSQALQEELLKASHIQGVNTARIGRLHFEVARAFAASARALIKQTGVFPDVIASHGQTVWHAPPDGTLQLGDLGVLAALSDCTVVGNFRTSLIALGGQGAPLVPVVERRLYRHLGPIALQNIGGIGNVTFLDGDQVLAFDTGPGNVMIDEWCRRVWGVPLDEGGLQAGRAQPDLALLAQLLDDPYLKEPPPKSTGRDYYLQLLDRILADWQGDPHTLLATLTQHTAESIADAYRRFLPKLPRQVVVSGGGALNRTLMNRLDELLPCPVVTSETLGVPVMAKEAFCFALMGLWSLWGIPFDGAHLGQVAPGPNYRALIDRLAQERPWMS